MAGLGACGHCSWRHSGTDRAPDDDEPGGSAQNAAKRVKTSPLARSAPTVYIAAAALYVFGATAVVDRILLSLISISYLGTFAYSIVLIPVCVVAVRKRLSVGAGIGLYAVLAYASVWGSRVGMNLPLSFSPAPSHVTASVELLNSLFFAVIVAIVNFVPTSFIWLATRFGQCTARTMLCPLRDRRR
jgi:hypothetical protein